MHLAPGARHAQNLMLRQVRMASSEANGLSDDAPLIETRGLGLISVKVLKKVNIETVGHLRSIAGTLDEGRDFISQHLGFLSAPNILAVLVAMTDITDPKKLVSALLNDDFRGGDKDSGLTKKDFLEAAAAIIDEE
jgi:hypothetical protein